MFLFLALPLLNCLNPRVSRHVPCQLFASTHGSAAKKVWEPKREIGSVFPVAGGFLLVKKEEAQCQGGVLLEGTFCPWYALDHTTPTEVFLAKAKS